MVACTICSKTVYQLEQVTIDEKPMHKTCLRCVHCQKILSAGTYAAVSGKYYCKPHFKQLFALKGNYSEGFGDVKPQAEFNAANGLNSVMSNSNSAVQDSVAQLKASGSKSSMSNLATADATCMMCQKLIYPVDMCKLDDRKCLHLGCFKCSTCNTQLTISSYHSAEGQLYCKTHQKASISRAGSSNNLGRVGSNSNLGSTGRLQSQTSVASRFNHHVESSNSSNSEQPKKSVSPSRKPATGEPNKYGATAGGARSCVVCTKTVYPVEEVSVDGILMHKNCLRCQHCNKGLSAGNYAAMGGKYFVIIISTTIFYR
jgi:hypothetical protein